MRTTVMDAPAVPASDTGWGPDGRGGFRRPPAEVVAMVCTGLPPILRGVDEVVKTLRWSHDFVWAWLGTEAGGTIPAMPEMRAGKTRVFSTPLLVQWNLTFFSPAPVRREMGRSHRALRGRKEVA